MTPASPLACHFRDFVEADPPGPECDVGYIVDMISAAPAEGKKVLLAAIGQAMIRAEVERQAKKKPRAVTPEAPPTTA